MRLILIISLILLPNFAFGQGSEYQLKAAFIERFCRFIQWENHKAQSFEIAIVGNSSALPYFEEYLKGRTIHNKPININPYNSTNPTPHIIFFEQSNDSIYQFIMSDLNQYKGHILTIGNSKDMANTGVLISFYLQDDKINFIINTSAVERTSLSFSSFLLEVAELVKDIQ